MSSAYEELGGQPPPKPKVSRGTRWSGNVPPEWVQLGYELRKKSGLPRVNLQLEADKFTDFWAAKTGAGATKLDWLATWRNWCRSARGQAEQEPPAGHRPCSKEADALKRVELFVTKGIRSGSLDANDFRLAVKMGMITPEQVKRFGF